MAMTIGSNRPRRRREGITPGALAFSILAALVACKGEPQGPASPGSGSPTAASPLSTAPTARAGDVATLLRLTPRVHLEPDDLTTSWQGTLKVGIDGHGMPIGEGVLNDLASRVSLRTWPELEEVPATLEVQEAPSPGNDLRGYVLVRPSSPLRERWYVLRAQELPSELRWHKNPTHSTLADGSQGVRFRVGSEPVVSRVAVCPGRGRSASVAVYFSELVTAAAPEALVAIAQKGVRMPGCQRVRGGGGPVPSLAFKCKALDFEAPLEVGLRPGLQSPAGEGVRGIGGSISPRYSFTPAHLDAAGDDSCRVFRP